MVKQMESKDMVKQMESKDKSEELKELRKLDLLQMTAQRVVYRFLQTLKTMGVIVSISIRARQ